MISTSANRRALLCGLAATPALTLPALAAPVSSDLARACIQATAHSKWIDASTAIQGWEDDRMEAEMDKFYAVMDRAITEPSAGLHDIAAKAQLALGQFLNYAQPFKDPEKNEPLDSCEALVVTVLREIIAMGEAA